MKTEAPLRGMNSLHSDKKLVLPIILLVGKPSLRHSFGLKHEGGPRPSGTFVTLNNWRPTPIWYLLLARLSIFGGKYPQVNHSAIVVPARQTEEGFAPLHRIRKTPGYVIAALELHRHDMLDRSKMTSAIPDSNSSSSPRGHNQSERDSYNRKKRKGPRLAHRKSRTGCQRCRARRVKCDESRPVCRDCHRHGIPCVYDRPAEEGAIPPSTGIQSRPLEPSPSDPSNDAHMELRLLHHFTLFTSATMPGAHLKRIKDCWSIDVPRLAFSYKPLLHAVFAIAALHLSKVNPDEAGLPDIHCNFLEQALREHRLCIGGITTQTADAVCFTSILLQIDVFATLQSRHVVSYEQVSEWMRLVRGSVAVFDAAMEIVRHNTHPPNIWCIIDTFPMPLRTNSDAGSFSFLLPTVPDDEDDETALEAYRGAVAHINATWLAMEAKEHPQISCRRLMVFPLGDLALWWF
ncbi:hypothetical protein KXV98_003862 [Aspergillus fumigatus]|nr:hypothetical protein KXX64_005985 [Aspergillus fumigatus]KAH1544857.1 hypothetical protein KXX57_005187 [Aspergillus fumigatus]KAH1593190.1 hypothetical protein KXX44_008198 [Aspergillus fumigatus]KAH2363540.1 hypothetical protein KXV98_003862 [Aspergillus fumigatus]KAH2884646.1 hypothetical protein KXV75_006749 [Aspergillus fumigatus]